VIVSKDIVLIHDYELARYAPRRSGNKLRAYCPVHGGDHQRSLEVRMIDDGTFKRGYGHCHNCKATVFVIEMDPERARWIEQHQGEDFRLKTIDLLRPRSRKKAEGEQWQQQERALLTELYPRMQAALCSSARARSYLEQRAIPLEVAQAAGVVYLPAVALKSPDLQERRRLVEKWMDRLIFPLWAADGRRGYAGRTLRLWKPGMDENEHKALIEEWDRRAGKEEQGKIRRWRKTNPAGYFGVSLQALSEGLVVVEGAFDRLALLAAGGVPEQVIALVGTALQGECLPLQIRSVVLALDGDSSGKTATQKLRHQLRAGGIGAQICVLPEGAQEKDWSEIYRIRGREGILPVLTAIADVSVVVSRAREQATSPEQEDIPTTCADCGTSVEVEDREFFYWSISASDVRCYCTLCRDQQTGQPCVHREDQSQVQEEETADLVEQEPGVTILTSVKQIADLAKNLAAGQYALDLETTGLNPRRERIITLALGRPGNVFLLDARGFYDACVLEQARWKEALTTLLQQEGVTWIGHNLKFDWSFLAIHFGVQLRRVYDTMLVEKLLGNGEHLSASLQATAARYGIEVSKAERRWFEQLHQRREAWQAPLPDEQVAYIVQDIEVPYRLWEQQQERIVREGLARVVELEQSALPAIAAMEVAGVCVDVARWSAILAEKRGRHQALTTQLQQELGEALLGQQAAQQETLFAEAPRTPSVTLSSSEQVVKALRAVGVEVESARKEILERVRAVHPLVPLILEWKELEKFLSSFGETFLHYVEEDGRIHATFDQLGAVSGRVICREPNLQQVPRPQETREGEDLRRCFVAPAGSQLLVADLSNIELRILAEVSGDENMLHCFESGQDLHSETARLMFGLSAGIDAKKHLINGKSARDIAKTCNFGLNYGMGAAGLAQRIGVGLDEAKRLMEQYVATYAKASAFLQQAGRQGNKQGYVTSLSGRRRIFSQAMRADPKRRGEIELSSRNHPIQATNADILKVALALLFAHLPAGVHVVLAVHDEIVLEVPEEEVKGATQILQMAMVQACRTFLQVVAIPVPKVLCAPYWRHNGFLEETSCYPVVNKP
jgi:DNA polymerase I